MGTLDFFFLFLEPRIDGMRASPGAYALSFCEGNWLPKLPDVTGPVTESAPPATFVSSVKSSVTSVLKLLIDFLVPYIIFKVNA
jgi:hypothetical protein